MDQYNLEMNVLGRSRVRSSMRCTSSGLVAKVTEAGTWASLQRSWSSFQLVGRYNSRSNRVYPLGLPYEGGLADEKIRGCITSPFVFISLERARCREKYYPKEREGRLVDKRATPLSFSRGRHSLH